jgi:MoaA/NifB/PqqE/SkfB family radical SAM enzyme|tara:strand:- start:7723 stop:8673 length:951 start_codon:yes stop_codon:yes gene_type:complete
VSITKKIDAITLIPEDYLKTILSAPKSVKIELSPRCNYRCGFCALVTRDKQPTHDMDFSLFKRITQQMVDAGVEEIGLFYLGESFMNVPLLVSAIRWCKHIGIKYVFLTTNGSLAGPDNVKKVMEVGLDSLKFSITTPDPKMFEEIIGVKSKLFYKALDNIREAVYVRNSNHFGCSVYASSIEYDKNHRGKMTDVLKQYVYPYVDDHYWLPLYSMGSFATAREEELGYRPTAGNMGRIGNLREPLPCWSVFTEGHVRADGGLTACCFDADGTWDMANLNEVRFMQGWNSKLFRDLREIHLEKDVSGSICEDCIAYR